jgi:beta-N-acetylhexosaminidase
MIRDVIRGTIGFEGLLMSDDVSMGALSGTLSERSRAAIAAGCDLVLHCNGNLDEMREVADAAPMLSGEAASRAQRALALRSGRGDIDLAASRARFADLLKQPTAGVMA